MKVYAEFFDYLRSRAKWVRQSVGWDLGEFVVLLQGGPDPNLATVTVEYEEYLIRNFNFGLSHRGLEPYYVNFLETRGLLQQLPSGWKLKLNPAPSTATITPHTRSEIAAGLAKAIVLASLLQAHASDGYYEVLEVRGDADTEAIQKAYRLQADSYLLNRIPGDRMAEHEYRIIATAYDVLSDPRKRATYDESRWPSEFVGLHFRGGYKLNEFVLGDNRGTFSTDRFSHPRQITVIGHTLTGSPAFTFNDGEAYRLRFQIRSPSPGNLASGDVGVEGVPPGGINTRWVVTSTDTTFIPAYSSVSVQRLGSTWIAEFELHIPEKGNSRSKDLAILKEPGAGELLVTIYALPASGGSELYRQITVNLSKRAAVTADDTRKALAHLGLGTSHEWMTPAEHIQIAVAGEHAVVTTKRPHLANYSFIEPWAANPTTVGGAIVNVRRSLEKFREAHSAYLNDIEPADAENRLANLADWQPYYLRDIGWQPLPGKPDSDRQTAFEVVQRSEEWRRLAIDGYELYKRCFEGSSELQKLIQKLLPGSRCDFVWTRQSGTNFVQNVPWALMYMEPLKDGKPADPEKFLGLRFRLSAESWTVPNSSIALGDPRSSYALHLLYWGDQPADEVARESRWQSAEFAKRPQSQLLPSKTGGDPRAQVVAALDSPAPDPVTVLYFFCHCTVGDGSEPVLRFGNSSKPADSIPRFDLGSSPLVRSPLVFANACTTSQADPHNTSLLESNFFDRGARSFIGTESKVPAPLASKFAWLFFRFFFRQVDPAPMAAGEALVQSRLFLWTQYRNVGGLFYKISNQYDLFQASSEELIKDLRH
jgi:curved DNA-binding protein CbpA